MSTKQVSFDEIQKSIESDTISEKEKERLIKSAQIINQKIDNLTSGIDSINTSIKVKNYLLQSSELKMKNSLANLSETEKKEIIMEKAQAIEEVKKVEGKKTKAKKAKKTTTSNSVAPNWAREIAKRIKVHVETNFNKNITDKVLSNWAVKLDRLTRSKKFVTPPTEREVFDVVTWAIQDNEGNGKWTGWAQQLRSPPEADKFQKIQTSMNRPKNNKNKPWPVSDEYKDQNRNDSDYGVLKNRISSDD